MVLKKNNLLNQNIHPSKLNQNLNLKKNIITQVKKKGIYIFGAHKVGLNLSIECQKKNIKVLGFFDNDLTKINKKLNNIKIYKPTEKNCSNKIIIVASGRYSLQIIDQLKNIKCLFLNLHEFQYLFDLSHQAEQKFRKFISALTKNRSKFNKVYNLLNDKISKNVFNGLLKIRSELNISYSEDFKSNFNDEYIDPLFIKKRDLKVFIDVGSYNGDTIDRIENNLGKINTAYLFEPELSPYIDSIKRFDHRKKFFSFNFGLSDKIFKINYHGEYSYDLRLDENKKNNTKSIQFIPLDFLKIQDVTFIKIDVEGAELSVLKGGVETIKKYKPKMAICAYHRANDFWEIVEFVLKINSSYKVGIRHYSDILDDTTLYFY